MLTLDGYVMFPKNPADLRLEDLEKTGENLQDRLTSLARYYDSRGHLIEHLHSALTLIVKSNSLNDSKVLAYQALEHIKGMGPKCHPGFPEWGHPLPEYLSLPERGNPFIKELDSKGLDKDEVKSLYESLGIKDDGSNT